MMFQARGKKVKMHVYEDNHPLGKRFYAIKICKKRIMQPSKLLFGNIWGQHVFLRISDWHKNSFGTGNFGRDSGPNLIRPNQSCLKKIPKVLFKFLNWFPKQFYKKLSGSIKKKICIRIQSVKQQQIRWILNITGKTQFYLRFLLTLSRNRS
jgi:hypothetical protein